jgi:hypothetical protein
MSGYNNKRNKIFLINKNIDKSKNKVNKLSKLRLKEQSRTLNKKLTVLETDWTTSRLTASLQYKLYAYKIPDSIKIIPVVYNPEVTDNNQELLEDFTFWYYTDIKKDGGSDRPDDTNLCSITITVNLEVTEHEDLESNVDIKLLMFLTNRESYYELQQQKK